jgi:exodeoxyribonuclease-3
MKILSWNVNGIRSVLAKGALADLIRKQNPDILCFQETRANPADVALNLPDYRLHWNWCRKQPGYSGVSIFTRIEPLGVSEGMGIAKHDEEGRVITAEFRDFYLVNVYVPNSKRDLSRLAYRAKEWDADFLGYVKKLEKKKPVIFLGDLNVAHKETDLANPDQNHKTHGFTDEERAGFSRFVENGFVDTLREFREGNGHYTWWRPFNNCRARNIGWRIDYVLISKSLRPKLEDAFILPEVMGSDHCPVGILLRD